jgi:prepilin-type N-terminal cleavage/methylation domain-containing protein
MKTFKSKLNLTSKGFTLIEVLVATMIFVIVLMIGTAIFLLSLGVHNKVDILKANQQSARNIIESINKDMREAVAIKITNTPTQPNVLEIDFDKDGVNTVCYGLLGTIFYKQNGCGGISADHPQMNQTGTLIIGTLAEGKVFDGQSTTIPSTPQINQPFVNINFLITTDTGVFGNKNLDTMYINTTITLRNYGPQ